MDKETAEGTGTTRTNPTTVAAATTVGEETRGGTTTTVAEDMVTTVVEDVAGVEDAAGAEDVAGVEDVAGEEDGAQVARVETVLSAVPKRTEETAKATNFKTAPHRWSNNGESGTSPRATYAHRHTTRRITPTSNHTSTGRKGRRNVSGRPAPKGEQTSHASRQ
jgi:hypothetical protein